MKYKLQQLPKSIMACPLRGDFCALRARGLTHYYCFGRLRGVRQGGVGYRAAPPSRPPLHPPEAPRWGFPASDISRWLRGFCSGSFLAPLGDLPARRTMPACDFALHASFHVRACSPKAGGRRIGCGKSQEWRLVDGEKCVVSVRFHAEWEIVQEAPSHDRAPKSCGTLT